MPPLLCDTMVRNINHCMIDRAIVNSDAVNILTKTWNKRLTKLFCHIHSLEALTTRKILLTLKTLEKLLKQMWCCLCETTLVWRWIGEGLILAFDTLRFFDSAGDPRSMGASFTEYGLPRGLFARARGNRLYVKLRNSEVLVRHRKLLLEYLEQYCTKHTHLLEPSH